MLCKGFETYGLQAFKQEAQMPLIIHSSSIANLSALWPTLRDRERPPLVKFIEGTTALAAAGGQHRMAALEKYTAIKTRELERAKTRGNFIDEDEAANHVKRIEDQLRDCRYWGVALYDDGKCCSQY